MDRLIDANPVEDESTLSLFGTSSLWWIPLELNGSIANKEVWLLPASDFDTSCWDILTAPWLYSLIENTELLDNVNGSTENREFLLDVEDILTRVKKMKFDEQ